MPAVRSKVQRCNPGIAILVLGETKNGRGSMGSHSKVKTPGTVQALVMFFLRNPYHGCLNSGAHDYPEQ